MWAVAQLPRSWKIVRTNLGHGSVALSDYGLRPNAFMHVSEVVMRRISKQILAGLLVVTGFVIAQDQESPELTVPNQTEAPSLEGGLSLIHI